MSRTTNEDIRGAFRDWLALTKHRAAKSATDVGGYRIGYDGYGRIRIEKIINRGGGITVIAGGFSTPKAFVEAVQLLGASKRKSRR